MRKYLKHCRKILSVEAYEHWKLHQVSLKIVWGRMTGSQRIHYFISKALELLLKEEVERGAAMLAQLLRAIHQMNLDNGSWEDAAAYMPGGDPLEKAEFAGDESEVEIIAARREAMSKLCKKSGSGRQKGQAARRLGDVAQTVTAGRSARSMAALFEQGLAFSLHGVRCALDAEREFGHASALGRFTVLLREASPAAPSCPCPWLYQREPPPLLPSLLPPPPLRLMNLSKREARVWDIGWEMALRLLTKWSLFDWDLLARRLRQNAL